MTPLRWQVNTTSAYDEEFRNPDIFAADLAEWQQSKSGPVRLHARIILRGL